MKHTTLPANHRLSRLANIRIQAKAVWCGPKDIMWDSEVENEPSYYGWRILLLEMTTGQTDCVESRAVYANLLDNSQLFAVLRAVYWNGKFVREAIKTQPNIKDENFLVMPARFVRLPLDQLNRWLSTFNDVAVSVNEPLGDDDTINIKRLRIERDYKTSIFEKVWQKQDKGHEVLNHKWDQVWKDMTEALANESIVTHFDENFRFVNPQVRYDFQIYHSDLFDSI